MNRFALALLMFAAMPTAPAAAQGIDTILPRLTWPDDAVTVSTKSCTADAGNKVACTLPK